MTSNSPGCGANVEYPRHAYALPQYDDIINTGLLTYKIVTMETMEEYIRICEEITSEEAANRPTYEELAEEYTDAWFDFD